ncbi:MAG TPA: aromatic-ring-hydroxylating dioxygenase subunit beta [Candidatus Elarobacter sp.]|jgi:p-cumate 2,3-dioxygenase beta subunit
MIADQITDADVERFLYREAALLDDWRLDEWAALFTDDAAYLIPANDTPDGDPDRDLMIVDDDHERILARVKRLKSRHAHREYPTSRTRHQVTNVMVERDAGGTLHVNAAFTVWRFRNERGDWYVGRYDYVLVSGENGLRIRSKRATLDMTSLVPVGSVSIIL